MPNKAGKKQQHKSARNYSEAVLKVQEEGKGGKEGDRNRMLG